MKKWHETYNNNPVMEYRFFFFFFDFFLSRWGDGEGLSELLKEGMKASDLFFMVRTISALMFIFSPVSVLVFLFLLPTALLGGRTWIIWIFHQPERTKAADLESGTEIMLGDEWKHYTVLSNLMHQNIWFLYINLRSLRDHLLHLRHSIFVIIHN